jgi:hypothetical protein
MNRRIKFPFIQPLKIIWNSFLIMQVIKQFILKRKFSSEVTPRVSVAKDQQRNFFLEATASH